MSGELQPKPCPFCGRLKRHHEDCDLRPQFPVAGAPTGRCPNGYADDPALSRPDEPEALDRMDWNRHIGQEVDQRARARELERERSARLLSQEERIAKAMQEAQAKRRDVSREMAVLRQMQAKQRPPEKIEKRVQILERVVYLGRAA